MVRLSLSLLAAVAAAWLLLCGVESFSIQSRRHARWSPCGQHQLLCSPSPIKTGTHTYASWRNTEDDLGSDWADEEEEGEEEEEEEGEDGEYVPEKGRRGRRNSNAEVSNPFIDWARKLYDSIFFYGLDAQIPRGRGRRGAGGKTRRAPLQTGVSKKSMFLTPTESMGEEYLSSLAQDKDPVATKPQPRSHATLLRRMQVLDECIKGMNIDLAVVDTALAADAADPAERKNLQRQRENILEAIETMQVQYVGLSVENDESPS